MNILRLSGVFVMGILLFLVRITQGTQAVQMVWMVPETMSTLNGTSSVGTLAYAINKIHSLDILPGYHINVTWLDSGCSSQVSIGRLTDLLFTMDVDVIVGPPCSSAMAAVADLAAYRDIPIFGWVSRQAALDDKTRFSTLVRISAPTSSLGKIFLEFCTSFSWYNVVLISTKSPGTQGLTDAMLYTFNHPDNADFSLVRHYYIQASPPDAILVKFLSKIKTEALIIFLVIPRWELRQYLLVAHRLGMTSGDYQFLFTEQNVPDQQELQLLQGEGFWRRGDRHDEDAKQAFRNLLYFTYASILELEDIQSETETAYNTVFGDHPNMPPYSVKRDRYSSFLNDAVILFANSYRESIESFNSTQGTDLFKKASLPSTTFTGLTGEVHIGSDGDRLPNFVVWDMGPSYRFRAAYLITYKMTLNGPNSTVDIRSDILWGDGRSSRNYQPPDLPPCGFYNERCPADNTLLRVLLSVFGIMVIVLVISAIVFSRWWRNQRDINNMHWKIRAEELDYNFRRKKGKSMLPILEAGLHEDEDTSLHSTQSDLRQGATPSQHMSSGSLRDGSATFHQYTTVANYSGNIVAVKKILKQRLHPDRKMMLHIKELMNLKHSNLTSFVGVCTEPKNISVLWEYCNKGSLSDIFDNLDMKLDSMFQFSIAIDICTGLEFLHASPLKCHGNLTSSNCVVDSRWLCKLTDFGLRPLRKGETECGEQISEDDKATKLFWLAPELLRTQLSEQRFLPTQPGDIFAFGIILKQILYLNKPYSEEQRLTPKDIVKRVAHPTDRLMRPVLVPTQDEYTTLRQPFYRLIQNCWGEDPSCRPCCRRALKKLNRINPYRSSSMMDNMVMMMERYSNHLEELVADRTAQLEEEKRKTDTLLYSMLPQKVADSLKAGKLVQAEAFGSVTIYFSDIVGFTDLASDSSPMEIVEFLNTLYTLFDDIIRNFDVYKVETIGDAYMLASGVPVPNGDQHVAEMADTALSILKAVLGYVIPHRPEIQLRIRIGMHSGPVVAGVVGLTMPRYCLFGDTVNTASRMESNGMPLMIHLSPTTATLLKRHPIFTVTDRGLVDIKGKGKMFTYWLQGKTGVFNAPVDPVFSTHKSSLPPELLSSVIQKPSSPGDPHKTDIVSAGDVAPTLDKPPSTSNSHHEI